MREEGKESREKQSKKIEEIREENDEREEKDVIQIIRIKDKKVYLISSCSSFRSTLSNILSNLLSYCWDNIHVILSSPISGSSGPSLGRDGSSGRRGWSPSFRLILVLVGEVSMGMGWIDEFVNNTVRRI